MSRGTKALTFAGSAILVGALLFLYSDWAVYIVGLVFDALLLLTVATWGTWIFLLWYWLDEIFGDMDEQLKIAMEPYEWLRPKNDPAHM